MNRAREPGDAHLLGLLQQTRQQVRFAVSQPQPRRHLAVAERRDVDPRDHDVRLAGAADQGEIEANVTLEGHSRRHVDRHSDVLIVI